MSNFPPLPRGISTAEFGHDVMKWGTGNDAALERISTITKRELVEADITAEMATAWKEFYLDVIRKNPKNPSANGRAQLMEHVALLVNQPEVT